MNAPRLIGEADKKARRLLLWNPLSGHWYFGAWDDDRYNRKPRPYWRYDGLSIMTSRCIAPKWCMDEPEPPPQKPEAGQ